VAENLAENASWHGSCYACAYVWRVRECLY